MHSFMTCPDLFIQEDISELLARIALGDRHAFDRLYLLTSTKLFGVALRLLKDRAEAEDALQEIYVRIWRRAGLYAASGASPMSWMIAIARNHAIDRLRARKTTQVIDERVMSIAENWPTPEASVIASSQHARVENCLERLDDTKANAVRGAYLDGYSYQDLANRFGVPLNTMRSWLRRSLLKLKECLEE